MATTLSILADRIRNLDGNTVVFSDAEIDALTDADMIALMESFGKSTLLALPAREGLFFAWLRKFDPPVWEELMGDGENAGISLAFLPMLQEGGNGFPICDLERGPNYFFTIKHIKPGGVAALPDLLDKMAREVELTVAEALMVEILQAPIDLWHFCHRHAVELDRAKRAVEALVARDWLVHLTKSEDLSSYIQDMFQLPQQRGKE